MTRWEYLNFDVDGSLAVTRLNEFGAEGWELVSAHHWATMTGHGRIKVMMKRSVLPPAFLVSPEGIKKLTEAEVDAMRPGHVTFVNADYTPFDDNAGIPVTDGGAGS